MYYVTQKLYFPPVEETSYEGILAVGGDLSTERLLLAYKSGIFPWFEADEPILWWSPSERMVVNPNDYKVKKSLRNIINQDIVKITFNQRFEEVITNCQQIKRVGQNGTWITQDMINAYCELYKQGFAQSVEVWQNDALVGGLYGVDSKVPNASKVAFVKLIEYLKNNNYRLLDCQVHNDHLEKLGAFEISRETFMKIIENN